MPTAFVTDDDAAAVVRQIELSGVRALTIVYASVFFFHSVYAIVICIAVDVIRLQCCTFIILMAMRCKALWGL